MTPRQLRFSPGDVLNELLWQFISNIGAEIVPKAVKIHCVK